MSFKPIVPVGGYGGWRMLNRTMEVQKQTFEKSPALQRDVEYFAENISKIKSAEDLVSDRRLLRVALGAFGLQDDLNNRFFIKKVLEEGAEDSKSFANRLADKRYLQMAETFGFDQSPSPVQSSDFAASIIESYKARQFEVAVGENDENLRLAMAMQRDLTDLAGRSSSNDTKWLNILGSAPMRTVFETAFGLPKAFGGIDLDMQLSTMKRKAQEVFGSDSVSQFEQPDQVEALVKRFLLFAELQSGVQQISSGTIALQLLQG